MNHQEVETLIRSTHRLWPHARAHAPMDAATVRLWQIVLADVPLDGAEAVLVILNRSPDHPFPPIPGEVAQHYHAAVDRASGVTVPDADQAWLEVSTAVQRRGWYTGPPEAWSHPAVGAAADAIGWRELCHGEQMVIRAHFLKSWPAIAARATTARVQDLALGALSSAVIGRRELT